MAISLAGLAMDSMIPSWETPNVPYQQKPRWPDTRDWPISWKVELLVLKLSKSEESQKQFIILRKLPISHSFPPPLRTCNSSVILSGSPGLNLHVALQPSGHETHPPLGWTQSKEGVSLVITFLKPGRV